MFNIHEMYKIPYIRKYKSQTIHFSIGNIVTAHMSPKTTSFLFYFKVMGFSNNNSLVICVNLSV